jgi:hypothetical protein
LICSQIWPNLFMDHHLHYIQNLFERTLLLWQKFWIREGKSNSQKWNWASQCTCLCDFTLCPSFLALKNTIYWWKMKGKKFQVALAASVWDSLESGELYAPTPVVFCSLALSICLAFPKCQTCSPWSLVTLRDDYGNLDKTKTKHVEC